MTKTETQKAAFIDINVFAQEGFTNGVFITVREIFQRLEALGIASAILSVSQASLSKDVPTDLDSIHRKSVQGITVHELFLETPVEKDPDVYLTSMRKLISDFQPNLIFLNTPAVFFEPIHIDTLRIAIDSGAKVVVLLADTLFPTEKKHPTKNVKEYYDLLKTVEVIVTSTTIRDLFKSETDLDAQFFPNIFTPKQSVVSQGTHQYITLVNHHPVKGRDMFNAIAQKMPDKQFLVVQTWPDVPPYQAPSDNVTFSDFIPDVRDLYKKTKILLIPSLYNEGPARIITEAMLNGIPVIAHRIGCLPEVGGEHVFFVDPPPIQSTEMIGTVLYPRVKPEDLDQVAETFVKIIREIDKNKASWEKNSAIVQRYAEAYCRNVEANFVNFVKAWFPE